MPHQRANSVIKCPTCRQIIRGPRRIRYYGEYPLHLAPLTADGCRASGGVDSSPAVVTAACHIQRAGGQWHALDAQPVAWWRSGIVDYRFATVWLRMLAQVQCWGAG